MATNIRTIGRIPTRFVTPTSPNTYNVVTATPFSANLTADTPGVIWEKVAGADMALFNLSGNTLSMTAKTHASPVDANGDNVYEVTLKAIEPGKGFFAYHPVRVTVTAT